MEEKFLQEFKKMRLIITENMKNIIIEMLITKQTLEIKDLTTKERKLLQKYFKDLKRQFAKEMSVINPMQTIILRNFINDEEIDK